MSRSLRDASERRMPARFAESDLSVETQPKSTGTLNALKHAKTPISAGATTNNGTETKTSHSRRDGSPVTPGPPARSQPFPSSNESSPPVASTRPDQSSTSHDILSKAITPGTAPFRHSKIPAHPLRLATPAISTSSTAPRSTDETDARDPIISASEEEVNEKRQTDQSSEEDDIPQSAQRPQARALEKTTSASISSSGRTRIQNDRNIDFFARRSVVRDLENNPPPPPARVIEEDSDEKDDDENWDPEQLAESIRKAASIGKRPPKKKVQTLTTAKKSSAASKTSVDQPSKNLAIFSDDSHDEDAIVISSSSPAAPDKIAPSTIKPSLTKPSLPPSTKSSESQKKGKTKAKEPAPSKKNSIFSTKQPPSKEISTTTSKQSHSTSARIVRIPVTPTIQRRADDHVSTVKEKGPTEGVKGTGPVFDQDAEVILKRAIAAWTKSHDQANARARAESAGLAYTAPPNPPSASYLHYNRPYLKEHDSRGRDEVGVAFDCRCCLPGYTVWRRLDDTSTSLLGSHLKTAKSKEGQKKPPTATGPIDRYVKRSESPTKRSYGTQEKMSKMEARQVAVGWVSEEARPLEVLSDKWFKRFLPEDRRAVVPTPKTTSKDVGNTYFAMQEVLIDRLGRIDGAIHLALDIWTSPNGHSFLGVIGCWHESGVAQRHVLDMITFTERHTAENTSNLILKLAKRLRIEDKIWFISGDNASTNTAMMRILGSNESLPRVQGEKTQIRCIAHILNLVSESIIRPFNKGVRSGNKTGGAEGSQNDEWASDEDDIEEASEENDDESDTSDVTSQNDKDFSSSLHPDDAQDKESDALIRRACTAKNVPYPSPESSTPSNQARSGSSDEVQARSTAVGVQIRQLAWFARKLRYNTRLRNSFQQTCANFDLKKPYSLIRDVATRWNSTYEMIERGLVLWEAIVTWQEHNPKLIPIKFRIKRAHRASYQNIVDLLKPLSDATLKFSLKLAPNIAEVIGTFEELDGKYRAIEENDEVSEVWREASRRAGAVSAQYYGLADETHIYYLAVLLHPNMRKRLMLRLKWEDTWINKAEELLRSTFERYYRQADSESQSQTQESQRRTKKPKTYLEEQMMRMEEEEAAQPPPDPVTEWVEGFIATKKGELLNALEWWWEQRRKGNEMEGLTALALDVFSAPATSVDVERLFSKAGRQVTPLRNRLKARKLQALVTVGAWCREDWVPDDLLENYYHQRKQASLMQKASKRTAEKESDFDEAGPSKRARIQADDDEE
ncbi:hypothetical protein CF319_g3693 [Tilletia indica]|nr:hypothetical protein CF319_g3693 [Tilletia indica]